MTRRVIVFWLAVVLLAAAFAVQAFDPELGIVDDAYISLRYSKNFAEGQGVVFNPGEKVEGYTCFLWVSILALVCRMHGDPVVWCRVLAVLAGALTVVLTGIAALSVRKEGKLTGWALLPVMLVAFSPALVFWGAAGMETMLFGLLYFASGLVLAGGAVGTKRVVVAALLAVLCAMTRPNGVLLGPVAVMFLLLQFGMPIKQRLRLIIYYSAVFFLFFGVYFIWRYSYYGYLLPNTFYAKVGAGLPVVLRGIKYVVKYLLAYQIVLLGIFFLLRRRRWSGLVLFAALISVVHTAYVAWVGGDYFSEFRFFVPIQPYIAVLFLSAIRSHALAADGSSEERFFFGWIRPVLIASLLCVATYVPYLSQRRVMATSLVSCTEENARAGKWFAKHISEERTVMTLALGGFCYYYGGQIVDGLGLADLHVAHMPVEMGHGAAGHEKFDADYIIERAPDYIAMSPGFHEYEMSEDAYWRLDGSHIPMIYTLRNHPRFAEMYEYIHVTEGAFKMPLYRRRDLEGDSPLGEGVRGES